ncbi:hypothetical protein ERHA55_37340 [Erwinia rhapontici]|nr:hypothetical protein [Erwinia rhapontici]BCQ46207.1 hypothetical protein ERHA55_37340 [Erwinia rhapontici]
MLRIFSLIFISLLSISHCFAEEEKPTRGKDINANHAEITAIKSDIKYNNDYFQRVNIDLTTKISTLDSSIISLKDSVTRIDAYSNSVMTNYNFISWFLPLIIAGISLISIPLLWSRTKAVHKEAVEKWIKENEKSLLDDARNQFLRGLSERFDKIVDEYRDSNIGTDESISNEVKNPLEFTPKKNENNISTHEQENSIKKNGNMENDLYNALENEQNSETEKKSTSHKKRNEYLHSTIDPEKTLTLLLMKILFLISLKI